MDSRYASEVPSVVHIGIGKPIGKNEEPSQKKSWFRRQLGAVLAWTSPKDVPSIGDGADKCDVQTPRHLRQRFSTEEIEAFRSRNVSSGASHLGAFESIFPDLLSGSPTPSMKHYGGLPSPIKVNRTHLGPAHMHPPSMETPPRSQLTREELFRRETLAGQERRRRRLFEIRSTMTRRSLAVSAERGRGNGIRENNLLPELRAREAYMLKRKAHEMRLEWDSVVKNSLLPGGQSGGMKRRKLTPASPVKHPRRDVSGFVSRQNKAIVSANFAAADFQMEGNKEQRKKIIADARDRKRKEDEAFAKEMEAFKTQRKKIVEYRGASRRIVGDYVIGPGEHKVYIGMGTRRMCRNSLTTDADEGNTEANNRQIASSKGSLPNAAGIEVVSTSCTEPTEKEATNTGNAEPNALNTQSITNLQCCNEPAIPKIQTMADTAAVNSVPASKRLPVPFAATNRESAGEPEVNHADSELMSVANLVPSSEPETANLQSTNALTTKKHQSSISTMTSKGSGVAIGVQSMCDVRSAGNGQSSSEIQSEEEGNSEKDADPERTGATSAKSSERAEQGTLKKCATKEAEALSAAAASQSGEAGSTGTQTAARSARPENFGTEGATVKSRDEESRGEETLNEPEQSSRQTRKSMTPTRQPTISADRGNLPGSRKGRCHSQVATEAPPLPTSRAREAASSSELHPSHPSWAQVVSSTRPPTRRIPPPSRPLMPRGTTPPPTVATTSGSFPSRSVAEAMQPSRAQTAQLDDDNNGSAAAQSLASSTLGPTAPDDESIEDNCLEFASKLWKGVKQGWTAVSARLFSRPGVRRNQLFPRGPQSNGVVPGARLHGVARTSGSIGKSRARQQTK